MDNGYKLFKQYTCEKMAYLKEKAECGKVIMHRENKIYPQVFHKVWINLRKPKKVCTVLTKKNQIYVDSVKDNRYDTFYKDIFESE